MQSVAAVLVLPVFSGSYITALAAVAWQVQQAAMSSSLLVLLQLTVLICLLSTCASETNSLRDSRCFLLFCQAPTSSRRCCCSIHAYIHTHIHTDIHSYIHAYIHTCMHANQSLVLNLPHTTCSAPILHHLFSLSCFPHAIFTFLLLLVGRS